MTEPLHWSATGLSVMQQCNEKFRRRYVEHEREDLASAGQMIGLALHHAAQLGVESQMAGDRIDRWYQLESALAHFDGLVQADADSGAPIPWDDEPGSMQARRHDLEEMVLLWWNKAPELWERYGSPTLAEGPFEVDLWGHRVVGQIDCATARDVVIDWKTGLRPMTEAKAEREMQKLVYPAVYERLQGRYPGLLVFVQFLRKEPTKSLPRWTYRLNVQEQLVDPGQKQLLRRLLDDDQAQVDAKVFPLNTSSGLCSPDWCPYWSSCDARFLKPLAERDDPAEAGQLTIEETV